MASMFLLLSNSSDDAIINFHTLLPLQVNQFGYCKWSFQCSWSREPSIRQGQSFEFTIVYNSVDNASNISVNSSR